MNAPCSAESLAETGAIEIRIEFRRRIGCGHRRRSPDSPLSIVEQSGAGRKLTPSIAIALGPVSHKPRQTGDRDRVQLCTLFFPNELLLTKFIYPDFWKRHSE